MILYSLTNSTLRLDVYEDKLVLSPKIWKSVLSKQWATARVIHYKDLKSVEIEKRYWPMRHRLNLKATEGVVAFEYRSLEAFYDQLKIFLERQILKYHHNPLDAKIVQLRSVPELVEEKKRKKLAKQQQLAA